MKLRSASRIARLVPAPVVAVASWPVACIAVAALPARRRIVARHQRRVTPGAGTLRILARTVAAYASYLRYWAETFRMPGVDARGIEAGFRVEGFEHIVAGLERGRGVILALPHVGGFVAEVLEPPEAFAEFRALRESFGFEVIGLDEHAGVAVLDALRANRIVCLLSDRDIQGNGVPVTFFGEETTIPAGPAFFALRSGAALVPVAVYFTGALHGHLGIVEPALAVAREGSLREDVARISAALVARFEALIARAPAQWHMFQPNWPSDRR